MISRSLIITSENAPWIRRSAASTLFAPLGCASRCRMISLSTVVWKMEPRCSSSSRSTPAFTRLPLWPMAIWPRPVLNMSGCALSSVLEPVVE